MRQVRHDRERHRLLRALKEREVVVDVLVRGTWDPNTRTLMDTLKDLCGARIRSDHGQGDRGFRSRLHDQILLPWAYK